MEITKWIKPTRSGYYALDGTWIKYRGKDFVPLIIFDVQILDAVNYKVSIEENELSYAKLLKKVYCEISANPKGFLCDGDSGLLKSLKKLYNKTPIQYIRIP